MERNKIIAVAALAVGIIVWRMGAMQQEAENIMTIKVGDGQIFKVPLEKARLFDVINNMMRGWKEEQEKATTLSNISGVVFKELLKDLDWVMQVRKQMQPKETEQQAAKRIMKDMPVVAFDESTLELLMAQLVIADYLQQPSLVELYSRKIADMIISGESMRLLSQGDQKYSDYMADLPSHLKMHVMHYIPKKWVEGHTIRHNGEVSSVAISADGNKVVTGSWDNTAKIIAWDGNAWIQEYAIQHNGGISSVAISADGTRVITGSYDDTAKIIAWDSNAWIEQYAIQHNGWVSSVGISADGARVVTGSYDDTANIVAWNGKEWGEQYIIKHTDNVGSVAISADGNKVVMGFWGGMAKIVAWDGNVWVEQHTIEHGDHIFSVAISADGHRVVTGSRDSTVKIATWNGNAWVDQHTIKHADQVGSIALSADGYEIVTGSLDKTTKITGWNGKGWVEQYEIRHDGGVYSVAISADGNKVVTGSQDRTAKIFVGIPTSLPGISDFETCLFERLLMWAKANNQKISKEGWAGNIMRSITWRDVEPVAKKGLQKLIRETMQQ